MIRSRVCVSHAALVFGVTLVPGYEMDVWPHDGLSGTSAHVHSDVESCDLAFLDLFVAVVVGHAVGPAQEVSIVLLWDEQSVSLYAGIPVIENESEI